MKGALMCLLFVLSISSCSESKFLYKKHFRKDWYTYDDNISHGKLIRLNDTSTIYNDTSKIDWNRDVYYWEYLNKNRHRFIIYKNSRFGLNQPHIYNPEKWKVKYKSGVLYLNMIGSIAKASFVITNDVGSDSLILYKKEN
jgi:hypothetical protein